MQKITSIELKNFQSHAHTKLKLDQGLNVITGESDQGKSAIIRALRWVLYNEPRGTDFIRSGTTSCEVSIELDTGFKIIRKRNSKENRYILFSPEGEEHIFEKVGTGVPKEITQIHGMPKIKLDTDYETTLNLDYQLDGAFLLTSSGAIRAKTIGRLIDVHIADAAIRDTTNNISDLKNREKQLEQEVTQINKELEEFVDLKSLKEKITYKKNLLTKIKKTNQKLNELKNLEHRYERVTTEIKKLDKLLTEEFNNLDQMQKIQIQLLEKHKFLVEFQDFLSRINKTKNNIDKTKNLLNQLKQVDKITEIYLQLNEKKNRYLNLVDLEKRMTKVKQELKNNQEFLIQTTGVKKANQIIDTKLPVLFNKLDKLNSIEKRFQNLNSQIKKGQELLNLLSSINRVAQLKEKLDDSYQRLDKLKEFLIKYKDVNKSIEDGSNHLQVVESELQSLIEKYSKTLKKLGKCPTCFSSVNDQIIMGIINNFKED